jgi:predicted Zn-dependent peptidase
MKILVLCVSIPALPKKTSTLSLYLMIYFEHFTLANGLQVYIHPDHSTPMAAVNVLYNVGSKDEQAHKTGFAHLFEHLMFGGSKHIPSYDAALQRVGGENNAFTSPDLTNYYITLPAANLETALWLESDRMLSLSFDPQVLEVQRSVVIEEFKQRYLNQPYGDVWLKLRPAVYEIHPYQWATIGKDISHIENATMDDVQDFFFRYYRPNNAVLVIAGNVRIEDTKRLVEKWFGDIPAGAPYRRQLPTEPPQTAPRHLEVQANVPSPALYKAYHMPARMHAQYHTVDLLSDILGRGKSSRLYRELVQKNQIFSQLQAYVTGSVEPGLLVINGKLNEGITLETADAAVQALVADLVAAPPSEEELQKVKNQSESTLLFEQIELLNRGMGLAFFANLGSPEAINQQAEQIQAVNTADIHQAAQQYLHPNNCTTMYYGA